MLDKFRSFMKEEKGQALAEYGLILALIAVVCVIALTGLGSAVSDKITEIAGKITGAGGGGGGG